ncbi:MAG TPA: metallophosphoesterase [Chthonomonadaceae bacterium]|nr:metallophosphoesterase [Chthonomonadaceae bacterium]
MSTDKATSQLTRRQLLQAAGGITFLALAPTRDGAFAATFAQNKTSDIPPPLPIFTALPYLQPGTANSKLVEGKEAIVVAWQTNETPAAFELEYGPTTSLGQKATLSKQERTSPTRKGDRGRLNHVATLSDLKLNQRYHYRVRMNGELLLEGFFTTRKPRGVKTRFVAFGDNSCGEISDHAIAYYSYRARPDFVMNTGDNVYSSGLDSEYARYFFPIYNADQASPHIGAPLLRSVPYYSVIANHDVTGRDMEKGVVADFNQHGDALGYYTNLHLPLNGPKSNHPTQAVGKDEILAPFLACAGSRFPNMANYSFDYGDAHFLCLDSNVYVDSTDASLQAWIAADLDATDAAWKFVIYHHPAFTAGIEHYSEQQMRPLAPLLERHGVDVVLSGHVHNYQRSRPFRFKPTDESGAKLLHSGHRLVPGTFVVDRKFDGKTQTKPDGIIHFVTGAGGNGLYDPQCNGNPQNWLHTEDNNADYVACFISDRHSLTVVDMDARTLTLTQVDEWGRTVDRCTITKA